MHKVRFDFSAFLVLSDKEISNLSLKDLKKKKYTNRYVATGDGRNIDHGYTKLVIRFFETWILVKKEGNFEPKIPRRLKVNF